MIELTHIDDKGQSKMVDVSEKQPTLRTAEAYGEVILGKELMQQVDFANSHKGNVLEVARIAGIMAAKRTSELIPLCHNIFISEVRIDFKLKEDRFEVYSFCKTFGVTGIEMEAMTAVSVASLTIYDMLKALSKQIIISEIKLLRKRGGKSGDWSFNNNNFNNTKEQHDKR